MIMISINIITHLPVHSVLSPSCGFDFLLNLPLLPLFMSPGIGSSFASPSRATTLATPGDHVSHVHAQHSAQQDMSDVESAQVLPRVRTITTSGNRYAQPNMQRRLKRQHTIRTYNPPRGPNLEPGAEPGIDTGKDDETELGDFNQVCVP